MRTGFFLGTKAVCCELNLDHPYECQELEPVVEFWDEGVLIYFLTSSLTPNPLIFFCPVSKESFISVLVTVPIVFSWCTYTSYNEDHGWLHTLQGT